MTAVANMNCVSCCTYKVAHGDEYEMRCFSAGCCPGSSVAPSMLCSKSQRARPPNSDCLEGGVAERAVVERDDAERMRTNETGRHFGGAFR